MSARADIPQEKGWFVGEKKTLLFPVKNSETGLSLNMLSVPMIWVMRRTVGIQSHYVSQGAVVLSKSTEVIGEIAVVGDYNSDPSLNTQRVEVYVEEDDYTNVRPGTHAHALKRTDDDSVLGEGTAALLLSAA